MLRVALAIVVALPFALAASIAPGALAGPACLAPPAPTFSSPLVLTKNGHQPLFVDFAAADPSCPLPAAVLTLDGVDCPTLVEETAAGYRVRALDHPTIAVGAHEMHVTIEGVPAPYVFPFVLT